MIKLTMEREIAPYVCIGRGEVSDKLGCQSAFKFDPAYCLICECYPDGAVAADNPISTDRLCIVVFQARSMGGAVGGSGPI